MHLKQPIYIGGNVWLPRKGIWFKRDIHSSKRVLPGQPPSPGVRGGSRTAWSAPTTVLAVLMRPARISRLPCCPSNPKASHPPRPVFFPFQVPKKKWGQCYCNMMLRACAAHHGGMEGLRWCWDSDGGLGREQGAKFSAVSSPLPSGTGIEVNPPDTPRFISYGEPAAFIQNWSWDRRNMHAVCTIGHGCRNEAEN